MSIGVIEEDVWFAGDELALVANDSARSLYSRARTCDIRRPSQSKPEMDHAALPSGTPGLALEDQHVTAAGSLGLHEIRILVDRYDSKDGLIETQGPLRIADRERDVRETECADRLRRRHTYGSSPLGP